MIRRTFIFVFLLSMFSNFNTFANVFFAKDISLRAQSNPPKRSSKSSKQNPKQEAQYRIKKIVIDAGHGGHDGGCHSKDDNEKDVTLAIAKKLGALVEDNFPEIEVIYTRKKDVFVELFRRAEIANQSKADLFISIHCNSMPENEHKTYGTETYVMGNHVMAHNLEVEKRENSSILLEKNYAENYDGYDPNSPIGHIMSSQAQDGYVKQSLEFASLVEKKFSTFADRRSRGVKQAGFLVIRETAMPSVLIETGYLSNFKEAEFLGSKDGQNTVSNSIFEAFKVYKKQTERISASDDSAIENFEIVETVTDKKNVTKIPILDKKNNFNSKNKIEKTELNGVEYRIQMASSPTEIDTKKGLWKQLNGVEIRKEDNILKYVTPALGSLKEAILEQNRIRSLGFKDAFVATYINGVRKK